MSHSDKDLDKMCFCALSCLTNNTSFDKKLKMQYCVGFFPSSAAANIR